MSLDDTDPKQVLLLLLWHVRERPENGCGADISVFQKPEIAEPGRYRNIHDHSKYT